LSGRSARAEGRWPAGLRRRAWRFWLRWFVFLNVVWLALISGFDWAETILGRLASAIAATAATAVRQTRLVFFHPRPS
jgi:hypothetical protein